MTLFYFASVSNKEKKPLLRFSGPVSTAARQHHGLAATHEEASRVVGGWRSGGDARMRWPPAPREASRVAGMARAKLPGMCEAGVDAQVQQGRGRARGRRHRQGPRRRARPAGVRDGASPTRPHGNVAVAPAFVREKLGSYF
jgi:hypothetical protein